MIKNDSIFNIFSTHSKAKNKTMVLISSADENDYTMCESTHKKLYRYNSCI